MLSQGSVCRGVPIFVVGLGLQRWFRFCVVLGFGGGGGGGKELRLVALLYQILCISFSSSDLRRNGVSLQGFVFRCFVAGCSSSAQSTEASRILQGSEPYQV